MSFKEMPSKAAEISCSKIAISFPRLARSFRRPAIAGRACSKVSFALDSAFNARFSCSCRDSVAWISRSAIFRSDSALCVSCSFLFCHIRMLVTNIRKAIKRLINDGEIFFFSGTTLRPCSSITTVCSLISSSFLRTFCAMSCTSWSVIFINSGIWPCPDWLFCSRSLLRITGICAIGSDDRKRAEIGRHCAAETLRSAVADTRRQA
mmetsp:Transcript_42897/g.69586  ORF Transcript_42897/g.69586 Transcript_42897/m.69586 type:complete len:207 (-) Transcript_42897:13-633(-)